MEAKDMFTNKDLTLAQFKRRIKSFVEHVKKNDPEGEKVVIFTYSGHGNEDGSLVFVDGKMLKPQELKDLINSYLNDTILIIDACYSGGNEGPKETYKKKGFKSNSLRIYASLAHLTAKEIIYDGPFFKQVKPFYRDVLRLEDIKGNGYFTAMIGLFFAEYKLKPDENISFKELVSYVTNKGKQYIEYLALRQTYAQRFEATVRLNQQPKVLPLQEKVDYTDINNQFILIQDPIIPIGFEPGAIIGVFFPMGSLGSDFKKPAIYADVFLGYELKFLVKNLFVSFNTTFMLMSTKSFGTIRRNVDLTILAPGAGVYYRFFRKPRSKFNMFLGANGGIALTFARASSLGPLKEESSTNKNTIISATLGANYKLTKEWDVAVHAKFLDIFYTGSALYGFSIGAGSFYHF